MGKGNLENRRFRSDKTIRQKILCQNKVPFKSFCKTSKRDLNVSAEITQNSFNPLTQTPLLRNNCMAIPTINNVASQLVSDLQSYGWYCHQKLQLQVVRIASDRPTAISCLKRVPIGHSFL